MAAEKFLKWSDMANVYTYVHAYVIIRISRKIIITFFRLHVAEGMGCIVEAVVAL